MNNILRIGILAGVALLSASCSDFLDEKGYETDYSYYLSEEGFESVVIASYQQIRWLPSNETGYAFELVGTDMYMHGQDGNHRNSFGRYESGGMNPGNTNVGALWNNNYKGVSTVNQALATWETLEDMNAETKNIRKGELLFLRAYYYYMLAVHYGDIPLVLETISEPKTDYVRVPQKQIWAQIIADATEAWSLLPWADASGNVTGDYGRASKGAAGHLLTKAHMFRYSQKYASNQSDGNMNEDRGAAADDLDKAISYASQVCNFGSGSGSGSNHQLEADFAKLWNFDAKTGLGDKYRGSEVLLPIQYSSNSFYNNQAAASTDGGNQLHMYGTGQFENLPLSTYGLSENPSNWGSAIGVVRDLMTGRGWKRFAPSPFMYSDNGVYGKQSYTTQKAGKLVDSRLYKSHVWVLYANTEPEFLWASYSNSAGSFDAGSLAGTKRYELGDSAIVLSLENLDDRFTNGTRAEKMALARSMERYWYMPLNSMFVPDVANSGERDAICMAYPSSTKFLDNKRVGVQDGNGSRDFFRYRLGETYILLAEALALKGDYVNAAAALNVVRERAAWKEGEAKYNHYYKYDGGRVEDLTKSTVEDMKVTSGFLSAMTEQELLEFFLDENGRETAGELNRFECLVRNGADFFVNRVKEHNHLAASNVKPFHRFRPIPQSHLDNLIPTDVDPNPQNYGY